MRRVTLSAFVGMIAAMALATTTSGAAFDPHFTVIGKFLSGEERNEAFHFKLRLLDELDHSDRVGGMRGVCAQQERKIRCRAIFHFNGEVGGRGDVVIKGNEGHGDQTFQVVDGSGDFAAVAGKMIIKPAPGPRKDRYQFHLVR